MSLHERSCASCGTIADAERRIIAMVARSAAPELRADVVPRLLHALEHHPPLRPARDRYAVFGVSLSSLRWAVAGGAACLLLMLSVRQGVHQRTALAKPEDERRVVEMIAATEPVRYVEADAGGYGASSAYHTQRVLLVGDSGW
jgi:hypothetical protein